MHKSLVWSCLIVAALLGGACKRDSSEKASDQVRKANENVREQQRDVSKEQQDVTKEQRDLSKEQRELTQAQGQAVQARANYVVTMRERLAKIDARLKQLETRTDPKARDLAISLRAQREAVANRLDTAGSHSEAEWDQVRKNIDDTVTKMERDLDDTLK